MNLKRALGSQWISTGYMAALSMLLVVFIARELGPNQFGTYSYLLSVVTIYAIIQDGGFKTLLFREYTSKSDLALIHVNKLLNVAIGHVILTTLLGCLILFFIPWSNKIALVCGLICFAFVTFSNFITAIFKGEGHFEKSAAWQAFIKTTTTVILLFAFFAGFKSVQAIFISWIVGICIVVLSPWGRVLWKKPIFALSGRMYFSCATFILIDFATMVYFRCDIILLKYLQNNEEIVGQYAAAYRFLEGAIMLMTPVAHICFHYLRLSWKKQSKFKKMFNKMLIGMIILSLTIYMIGIKFADYFVLHLYGDNFMPAAHLSILLLGALLFMLPNYIVSQAIISINEEKIYAIIAIFTAILNICGNLILIPKLGADGAAYSTIITEGILFVTLLGVYMIKMKYSFLS